MNFTKKHNATHHSPAAQPFMVPFYRTHSFRIFVTFVLFGATLSLGFGWAVIDQMERIRKKMDLFKIQEYAEAYLADDSNNIPTHPINKFLSIYDDIRDVPDPYHSLLRGREDGSYFSDGPDGIGGPGEHRYIIHTIPSRKTKLYFILDDGGFESRFNLAHRIDMVFFYGFILALIVSIITGKANAHLLAHPMHDLLEKISGSDPASLPVGFSEEYAKDEVGSLARALDQTNQRIRAFIERETQFTRDASHELRTPVTVIKGAVEILGELPEERKAQIRRPLERIERSLDQMETLIESLLQKAREDASASTPVLAAGPLVKQTMAENQYLIDETRVDLRLEQTGNPKLTAGQPDVIMAISNLIRNACVYTRSGHITVRLDDAFFEVEDTGPGIDPAIIDQITDPFVKGEASKGHGIGLSIVKRVCDQFGWHLAITNQNPGTRVRITFADGLHP